MNVKAASAAGALADDINNKVTVDLLLRAEVLEKVGGKGGELGGRLGGDSLAGHEYILDYSADPVKL